MSKVRKGIVVLVTAAVCAVAPAAMGASGAAQAGRTPVVHAPSPAPNPSPVHGVPVADPQGFGSTWQ